ncbi:MAG: S8 family serine peptidase [Bacteroidales bacterium]|nr:S8 family serine peptidase [Bacteroidales bacterium]
MFNRRLYGISLCLIAVLASCSVKESAGPAVVDSVDAPAETASNVVPGYLYVKFNTEPDAALLNELESSGVYTLSRMYPPAGKFEKRHREAGLHLWYVAKFDPERPVTKAADDFSVLSSVGIVGSVPVIRSTSVSFNDPRLHEQWHYQNDGSIMGSIAGSDADVVRAWDIETGSPEVVVAVSDEGVDWTHPDIAQNMWVNDAEFNGVTGVDDDNNGYVDDVYGCSFWIDGPETENPGGIIFAEHGTHVAGTIAAVNNNGVGVCGIAGGDGSPTSGVRIMTLQTSEHMAYVQPPFVYAADNGAVLMNCSWGADEMDLGTIQAIREAMQYFNTNAGFNEMGVQTGPMAGGLIVFAAGNDASDKAYPCMVPEVIAVSAVAHSYQKTSYSNYGEWVDIAAPGGDVYIGAGILSTVTGPAGYASWQGTSMACPHVTGTAALIVSHFKGPGFTRQMLLDILLGTARNIDVYNTKYQGQIGVGIVDAYRAVSASLLEPDSPVALDNSVVANYISLEWPHTASSDDKLAFAYELFYSKNSLSSLNPANPGAGVVKVEVRADDVPSGENLQYRLEGLDFETTYHVRMRSRSVLGKYSDLTADVAIQTKSNSVPVIAAGGSTDIQLKSHESVDVPFNVSDPDGHPLTCSVSLEGTTVALNDGVATIHIDALSLDENANYVCELSVSDGYSVTKKNINISVAANTTPVVKAPMQDIVINEFSEKPSIALSDFFSDADEETLTYTVRSLTPGKIATGSISGGKLVVTPVAYGTATLEVTASDARKTSVSQTIQVLIRDGKRNVEIYPNPFVDKLSLRTAVDDTVDLVITNRAGAIVFSANSQNVGPFTPLELDLSDLPAGAYYLKYSGAVTKDKFTIIKK